MTVQFIRHRGTFALLGRDDVVSLSFARISPATLAGSRGKFSEWVDKADCNGWVQPVGSVSPSKGSLRGNLKDRGKEPLP